MVECKEWEAVVWWIDGGSTTRRGHDSKEEAAVDVEALVDKFGEMFGPVDYTEAKCVNRGGEDE